VDEKIYMIPVNDAFSQKCDCPFCYLEEKYEEQCLESVLGESVMQVDFREETNENGFCQKHFYKLLEQKNKLPFALTLESHLAQVNKKLETISSKYIKQLDQEKHKNFFKQMISTSKVTESYIDEICNFIDNLNSKCVICSRIEKRMKNYFDVFFYMWKNDKTFLDKVLNSRGFCLYHLNDLLKHSQNHLKNNPLADFLLKIYKIQKESMKEVYSNVHQFTLQFDYRNANTSASADIKNSLPQAVLKLAKYKT